MKLDVLTQKAGLTLDLPGDMEVVRVTEDSRKAGPGTLFVASSGEHADGHDFIPSAVEAGAVAAVGSRRDADGHGVPYATVTCPLEVLGKLAHALEDNPSQYMVVAGITGTNGKSSTVLLTASILRAAGHYPAVLGTLGYEVGGPLQNARHTTPFGEALAALFGQARDAGHSHVVMEVASHALEQERVAGIDFHAAAFTNLTQDHLDYHKTMEDYLAAKLKLFERVRGDGRFTVVNREDPAAPAFRKASGVDCLTYGKGGDCRAVNVKGYAKRTSLTAKTPWGDLEVELNLVGAHNVMNALCAITLCGGLGVPLRDIGRGLAALDCVPGRFEAIDTGQDFQVIVDYAHTEDGLRNVLQAARAICTGQIVCVFGCGGDRDRGKRPKMARAAAEGADFCIITSDNPRTEDPATILLDIEAGMQHAGRQKQDDYLVIQDRGEAIRYAINAAQPGDLVLIAGKGHEDYQILGTERFHFDDRETARTCIKER